MFRRILLLSLLVALVSSCVSSSEPPPNDWIEETPRQPEIERTRAGGIILPAGTFDFMPADKRVWLHTQEEALDPSGMEGIRVLEAELEDEYWPLVITLDPWATRDRLAQEHREYWRGEGSRRDVYGGFGGPLVDDEFVHLFQCSGDQITANIWELDNFVVKCGLVLANIQVFFPFDPDSSAAENEPSIADPYLQWFRQVRRAQEARRHVPRREMAIELYTYIRDHDIAYESRAELSPDNCVNPVRPMRSG